MTRKPIRSYADLEVYQNTYSASVVVAARILPKLPESEKFDLTSQLSRSTKAVPRLIAEGFAKKHQKQGFQKYLDNAMAECNETVVSLQHVRDIYKVETDLCDRLIKTYDVSGRQIFKLALAWDKFKSRRQMTMPNDHTGRRAHQPHTINARLSHIGIAVKNIDDALKIWQSAVGLKLVGIEEVPHQKARVAVLQLGESHIELLEALSEDSTIKKFIEKKGEGLHHICIEVTGIEEKLRQLKTHGVLLIDEVPRPGAMASKVAFVHPRDFGGVLIELCEKSGDSD